jgi:MSHA pilin protein MshD
MFACNSRRAPEPWLRAGQRGLTLIELIVFIVIVSVALAGVLTVLNFTVLHSADPMVRKQALSVAEALMDEVTLQSYTYCDPTDATVTTANAADTLAGNCTTTAEAVGPEAGQTRYSTSTPFNNVNDYNGFSMAGIRDLSPPAGTAIANLSGYTATVAVANAGTTFNAANGTAYANDAVARIDVTVSKGAESITLTSYRFRYAPNSP